MESSIEEQLSTDVWNTDAPWARREKYFLFLRDHKLRHAWKSKEDHAIYIDELYNDYDEFFYTLNSVVDRIQPIGNTMQLIYWRVEVQPALPLGTTINFDLDINITKFYNYPGTGTITYNNDVTQGCITQSPAGFVSSTVTENRPFCSPYERDVVSETETYSLMMDNTTMVTGTTLSTLIVTSGISDASTGCVTTLVQDIGIATSTPNILGCICCDVVNDPTPSGIRNTLQLGGTNQITQ
jgi:hypothetical protein